MLAAKTAITALKNFAKSLKPINPKFEALGSWSSQHPRGTVIAQRVPSLRPEGEGLDHLRWVQRAGRTRMSGPVLVTAWLGKDKMDRILVPPISDDVTMLLYSPETAWYEAARRRRRAAQSRIRVLIRDRGAFRRLSDAGREALDSEPPPEEPAAERVLVQDRRARALGQLDHGSHEMVSARLYFFVGGYWAAFAPDYPILSVTHLMSGGGTGGSDDELRTIPAKELEPGDFVVLVRGSDRDALRHAVDEELPSGARDAASEWQKALLRFVESGHSQAELIQRLAKKGCSRSGATIRRWLSDDRMIAPRDALDGTLEAIQEATGDSRLAEVLNGCKEAIRLVRGMHIRVGRRLAAQLVERAREWIEVETAPDELIEVEERLVLLTLDSIDPETVDVPREAINRLREAS